MRVHYCVCMCARRIAAYLTRLVVQKLGPPPNRPPPRLTPSPDPKQQIAGMFEEEALEPDANTNSSSTTQEVRQTLSYPTLEQIVSFSLFS